MAANGVSDIFSELLSIIEIGNRLNRALRPGSTALDPSQFKNFVVASEISVPPGTGGAAQNALQWTVSTNMAFLCTFVGIKSFVAQVGLSQGYPDDFGGLLNCQAWLTVDGSGNPISKPNAIYLGLANRPVCFLFPAGHTLNLIVAAPTPIAAPLLVASALYGWVGGSDVLQVFQSFQTLVGNTMGYPGGSGSGSSIPAPNVPTNAPF